ncbi:hypothetical protein LAZ67_13000412 [Cordylochernes scorpioides]|uniref:Transposase n=1 Tax=Cordylochernes scorpioides TaxID=51811 RepID=A0ABY6L2W5_9ARAC|nr:hypothetical protein LAZ67_13000412 [Cordylochernes scorpioides]
MGSYSWTRLKEILPSTRKDILKRTISTKRPGLKGCQIKFHQDNARPHTAQQTLAQISRNRWTLMLHPAYSPDLAPSNFYLFGKLKNSLHGRIFKNDEMLLHEVRGWFRKRQDGHGVVIQASPEDPVALQVRGDDGESLPDERPDATAGPVQATQDCRIDAVLAGWGKACRASLTSTLCPEKTHHRSDDQLILMGRFICCYRLLGNWVMCSAARNSSNRQAVRVVIRPKDVLVLRSTTASTMVPTWKVPRRFSSARRRQKLDNLYACRKINLVDEERTGVTQVCEEITRQAHRERFKRLHSNTTPRLLAFRFNPLLCTNMATFV